MDWLGVGLQRVLIASNCTAANEEPDDHAALEYTCEAATVPNPEIGKKSATALLGGTQFSS
jgi:hypothetical protein